MRLHCIELPVPSPDEAGRWLESVLHFLPVGDGRLYVCGNCRLRLVTAEGDAPARRTRSSGLSTSPLRPRMPVPFCVRCFQKVSSLSTTEVFPFLTRRFSEPEQNISI